MEEDKAQQSHNAEQREQIKQVVAFLNSKEARGQALDIILAYTTTKDNRDLFSDIDICKILLRMLPEQGNHQVISKILINFSQDQSYIKKLIDLNLGIRVLEYFKQKLNMEMAYSENAKVTITDNQASYQVSGYEKTQDPVLETIELLILLLSNISVSEEGQKHLLGNDKLKGALIENLFGIFQYFQFPTFDFIANILTNIAAFVEGRQYMLQNKFLEIILEMVQKEGLSQHRRRFLLEAIRNMCFEYEQQEQNFIKIKLVEQFIEILTKLSQSQEINQQINFEIKAVLDSLVLLANSQNLLKIMKENNLDTLLNESNALQMEEGSDAQIQIMILQNQLVAADQEEEEEKQDDNIQE